MTHLVFSGAFRRCLLSLAALSAAFLAPAQIMEPVKWSSRIVMESAERGEVVISATIDPGWHLYSNLVDPDAGPTPLTLKWDKLDGATITGDLTSTPAPTKTFDEMFQTDLSWWSGKVTLRQSFKADKPKVALAGTLRYQACDNRQCLPPTKEQIALVATVPGAASASPEEAPAPEAATPDTAAAAAAPTAPADSLPASATEAADIYAPVTFDRADNPDDFADTSLWWIFGACFVGGLLALFTPCVWPMIPMTVSFFLKQNKSRGKAIGDALAYGLSIIIIYVALGLAVTAVFGASSLNALATSAVCNTIFFLLLVVFAISFFGAFEIKLPSGLVNRMGTRADSATGLLGTFFMAFTLALVSFSCTGPIIGTLLVEAATTGDKFGPAVGMLGFSLALAIPFALFAMFPSWLKGAPRSGGWMETVKVVLGFIELALSLKFLSVADLAYGWHILDREVFLALWIVIFALLGMYLLGRFNFSHYGDANPSVGIGRFFCAMASLAFAVYLVPGLWGAPLKGVSAFVPPLYTQDFNLYGEGFTTYSDFEEGMAAARREGKPVFVDFSGYGCVNCRKMEGAVLDQPDIKAMIDDNFVAITLMVDEKRELPQPLTVAEGGREVRLDTYGEKWSWLQRHKFRANAQPYYVILSADGELLSGPYGYDENIPRFARFLQQGMRR